MRDQPRIPTAILMSGTGSNARKLLAYPDSAYEIRVIISDNKDSNYRQIAEEYGVEHRLNDIYAFYRVPHPGEGLTPEKGQLLKDLKKREAFDRQTRKILQKYGIKLIAAAGYDWIISAFLCQEFVIVNVHPGDLQIQDEQGRRRYIGQGWVPTAKAILNGETNAHSTTHLVTADLDSGPIARVSKPVPINLPQGITARNILPPSVSLKEVIQDINHGGGELYSEALIYTHSLNVQQRLKEAGDWVEFPLTLDQVARLMLASRLVVRAGRILLDGVLVKDLFLMEGGANG